MIKSAAYDLIKQEGIKEGLASGLQQGIEQGLQQGLEQGLRQGLRQAIADNLEARFGMAPEFIVRAIAGIEDIPSLKRLHRLSSTTGSLDEFKQTLSELTPAQ